MFLLILTASSLLFGGILVDVMFRPLVSSGWREFFIMCLLYGSGLIFLALSDKEFKDVKKYKLLAFQVAYFIVSSSLAFSLFFLRVVPLPTHALGYAIFMFPLIFVSMVLLDYAVRRWGIFK